jgi:hypothetical protein
MRYASTVTRKFQFIIVVVSVRRAWEGVMDGLRELFFLLFLQGRGLEIPGVEL